MSGETGTVSRLVEQVSALQQSNVDLARQVTSLVESMKELSNQVSGMRESSAALNALVDASINRTRDEVTALFTSRHDHAQRISNIERDYVPKSEFNRMQEENDNMEICFRASFFF